MSRATSLRLLSALPQMLRGGAGLDAAKTGTARLTVELPRETHRRFKIACTIADTRMNDEIRRVIERRCAELEASR